MHSVRIL